MRGSVRCACVTRGYIVTWPRGGGGCKAGRGLANKMTEGHRKTRCRRPSRNFVGSPLQGCARFVCRLVIRHPAAHVRPALRNDKIVASRRIYTGGPPPGSSVGTACPCIIRYGRPVPDTRAVRCTLCFASHDGCCARCEGNEKSPAERSVEYHGTHIWKRPGGCTINAG